MPEHDHKRKKAQVLRLRHRTGIWLWDYDQIKYTTPFQWFAGSVIGLVCLVLGAVSLWLTISRYQEADSVSFWLALILPLGLVSMGLLQVPGAIIYVIRCWRGRPVDVWTSEAADRVEEEEPQKSSRNNASDHH